MADFSLDLNEDQLQMQKWVHDFAENVIRPVAAEYDEKEETPWPVIQEAANIGLYSREAMSSSFFSDPTGLTFPLVSEELTLGLRRHRARDLRHHARRLRHRRQRHARADRRVGPAVLRHRRRHPPRRVRGHRARRRLGRVSSLRTRAVYDEAKDEWVINGIKTWITNGGIDKVPNVHVVVASVEPELKAPRPRELRRPAGHPGPHDGSEVQEDGHPRQPHRRGRPRRRARPGSLPARRQGEARRALRPCP